MWEFQEYHSTRSDQTSTRSGPLVVQVTRRAFSHTVAERDDLDR